MTPCVAEDEVNARVASRLARQWRVLLRDEPPAAWFLVDYFALLRQIGTPQVMAGQMRHVSHEAHCYIARLTGRDERSYLWI